MTKKASTIKIKKAINKGIELAKKKSVTNKKKSSSKTKSKAESSKSKSKSGTKKGSKIKMSKK